jgi:hypothetical protein
LRRRILKSGLEEKDEERWRGEYEECRGEEYYVVVKKRRIKGRI